MEGGQVDVRLGARRFFIITAARSGSTLLSAILADAGASFDMTTPAAWDRKGGDMEHPLLWRALHHFTCADAVSLGRPRPGIARMRWVAHRSIAKRLLRRALDRARFVKVYGADRLVRLAYKIGFFPTVIVSYRRFEDQAVSLGVMYGHANAKFLRENYERIYDDGLVLLHTFGGCTVAYEELVDPRNVAWADALAAVTGLPREKLIEARAKRVESRSTAASATWHDSQLQPLVAALDRTRNIAVSPSSPALRAWRASIETDAAAVEERQPRGTPQTVSRCAELARTLLRSMTRSGSLVIRIAHDKSIPLRAKLAAMAALLYFMRPLPVLDRVSEVIMLAVGFLIARQLFPPSITAEHVDALRVRTSAAPLARSDTRAARDLS